MSRKRYDRGPEERPPNDAVLFGYDRDGRRYQTLAVDEDGKVKTTT